MWEPVLPLVQPVVMMHVEGVQVVFTNVWILPLRVIYTLDVHLVPVSVRGVIRHVMDHVRRDV